MEQKQERKATGTKARKDSKRRHPMHFVGTVLAKGIKSIQGQHTALYIVRLHLSKLVRVGSQPRTPSCTRHRGEGKAENVVLYLEFIPLHQLVICRYDVLNAVPNFEPRRFRHNIYCFPALGNQAPPRESRHFCPNNTAICRTL